MISSSCNKFNKMVYSKGDIIRDLKRIGLKKGDHVAVALSYSKIGHVVGGPKGVLDALLDVVGSEGTIMMNAHTNIFIISELKRNYMFNFKSTPVVTGYVPELLRLRDDSIRSKHPTMSVVAYGKYAKYLTDGHDECSNPYLPFFKLSKINGKYLAIGLDNRLVAIRHAAQYKAGLFDIIQMYGGTLYENSEGLVKMFVQSYPPCTTKLPEQVPVLENMGIVEISKIGMAKAILASASNLLSAMTDLLKGRPESYLCDKIWCIWCREVERELNLYDRIVYRKYYQKYAVIRTFLSLINRIRIKKYRYLRFNGNKNKITSRLLHLYLTFISFLH